MLSNVLLNRSTIPLPCGWYGVVWDFLTFSREHTSANSSDSNCRPWSECNCSGGENQQNISSTSFLLTVVASWFFMAYTSAHLVKWSIATKTYLQPSCVSGRGPIIIIINNIDTHHLHGVTRLDSVQFRLSGWSCHFPGCASRTRPTPSLHHFGGSVHPGQ